MAEGVSEEAANDSGNGTGDGDFSREVMMINGKKRFVRRRWR